MADQIEEIKSKLSIEDVVSGYVQLKKAGRNLKGLCPFHSENTPSFVVSPEKQICHCFGCNKGGDIFTFIQELEGVSFAESMQILADRAGIKIEKISKYKGPGKDEKEEYYKAHELACEFFEKELHKTKNGKKVLEYLKKRGLNLEMIKEFRIGFAPDSYDELYPYLLKKGVSKNVLINSGLVSAKNLASDNIYDKFRARLIFPIFNYLGRICGFGGRALKKDQSPKYLNSPENPIYDKSNVLYGFYHAKQSIKEAGEVVLVEGYFDVLLPFQVGCKNVVATCGTALTEKHVRYLKRFTSKVVTFFDNDSAGFEATRRSYPLLQREEISMKTVVGGEGKDPADIVKDAGKEEFGSLVANAPEFLDFYIKRLVNDNDITSIGGRRAVLKEVLPYLQRLSPSLRDIYIRKFASSLGVKEQFLYDEISNFKLSDNHPAKAASKPSVVISRMSTIEIILAIVLAFPSKFNLVVDKINFSDDQKELEAVYKALFSQYNASRNELESWDFKGRFSSELRDKVDVLMLYGEDKYGDFGAKIIDEELQKLIDRAVKDYKVERLGRIHKSIIEAEEAGEKEKLLELLQEQQKILSK